MTIDNHFKPEEYAKCIKCLKENRHDIYSVLNVDLKYIQNSKYRQGLYKTAFYTDLIKYRPVIGERLFFMYDAILGRILELN